ncbi:MAG TPA: ATP-binding protein [Candidatus Megaira endosymbiont of Hartmannula sinica]|nr:ATP-binding protein [Candidatus Megaera endosymbiont of Hartmannula sinica]
MSLARTLDAQAQIRSFDEAIIFHKNNNQIIAQTSMSLSLSFINIKQEDLKLADNGSIVQISSPDSQIRILVKLTNYDDIYLVIGKLLDTNIVNYIGDSKNSAKSYLSLKDKISYIQLQFIIIFSLISVIIIFIVIRWGMMFAGDFIIPIRHLLMATKKVENGDFNVRIKVDSRYIKGEFKILTDAFNKMIRQIKKQQRDLSIAERASAWSDVAQKVAHEIKNPLTPIQLSAERLSIITNREVDKIDKNMLDKYVKNIMRHSEDIKNIVLQFVNFAKLPSPEFDYYDLIKIITEVIQSRVLLNNNIKYVINSIFDKYIFKCDRNQISRVLNNIFKNAEEAMDGINIQDKKINIKVYLSESLDSDSIDNNKLLVIEIIDNGPGFNSDIISKAHKAYMTSKSSGMGLGLAIVDRIIYDHFGKMEISNNKSSNFSGGKVKLIFNINNSTNN